MAEIGKTKLNSGWLAARSTNIQLTRTQLTTTHPPAGPTSPWMDQIHAAAKEIACLRAKVAELKARVEEQTREVGRGRRCP
ncbi:hypothetical protein VitviT2T_009319 [Vitis vinifera]|uniref:Uncharacterized protein n=1 Tax=Vitis vinifera TaxID=29760 RepID=A0ABY9C565_VITVI|nr:hypothetical protein VitviT2T_009319 [Vitis vinifera]